MSWNAYLPAGRKVFYYYHYRKDILERHGVTEFDTADARAYALASRRSKRSRAAGTTAGGNSDDAGTYAPATRDACRSRAVIHVTPVVAASTMAVT